MDRHIDAVIFKGGGVKGLALVGAYHTLNQYLQLTPQRAKGLAFAGTSAGAIVASMLASGWTSDEIKNELLSLDFSDKLDHR